MSSFLICFPTFISSVEPVFYLYRFISLLLFPSISIPHSYLQLISRPFYPYSSLPSIHLLSISLRSFHFISWLPFPLYFYFTVSYLEFILRFFFPMIFFLSFSSLIIFLILFSFNESISLHYHFVTGLTLPCIPIPVSYEELVSRSFFPCSFLLSFHS